MKIRPGPAGAVLDAAETELHAALVLLEDPHARGQDEQAQRGEPGDHVDGDHVGSLCRGGPAMRVPAYDQSSACRRRAPSAHLRRCDAEKYGARSLGSPACCVTARRSQRAPRVLAAR